MADTPSSIFNKKATEKLRNPDDLDKYVRVTNPSVWVILMACIALLVGLLSWGIFGTVATNVTATGAYQNGVVLCFVSSDEADEVHVGDVADVDGFDMTVSDIGKKPMSRNEAHDMLGSDYLAKSLVTEDWTVVVTFEGDASMLDSDVPLPVSITTERIPPITLVLGGRG